MRIRNYGRLVDHGNRKGRELLLEIMEAGLSAGDPSSNMKKLVRREGDKLILHSPEMELAGDHRTGAAVYDLSQIERIYLFAIGKGIQYITKVFEEELGERLNGGLVICKHGDAQIMEKVEVIYAGHPVPDEFGIGGCRRMLAMAKKLKFTAKDLVITAMGNGCSSLCTLPDDGISLDDVKAYTKQCLIDLGMPTADLSHLRNQIDLFRGGRFIRALAPAKMIHILGQPPNRVKNNVSGYDAFMRENSWIPNLPDCTTPSSALGICRKWELFNKLPPSILRQLQNNPAETDTVFAEEFETYDFRIFACMPEEMSAVGAAMQKARELGFAAHILARETKAESTAVAILMANIAINVEKFDEPFTVPCAVFTTGELIVTVGGQDGIGGTNQEFSLAAAKVIRGNGNIVMAGADTDGTDGPGGMFHPEATALGITNLTGGIVDGCTIAEAMERGVDIDEAIRRHDTSQALWRLDSGIAADQNISVSDFQCALILAD